MPYSQGSIDSLYSFSPLGSATLPTEIIWETKLSPVAVNAAALPCGYVLLPSVPEAVISREDTNSSTVLLSKTEVKVLEQLYIFRRRKEVLALLNRNPFLAPLLLEASGKVRHFFPGSQLSLEVVSDFETDDSSQLLASITTHLPVGTALDKLNEFDANWWLEAAGLANGKLCIDVEFE